MRDSSTRAHSVRAAPLLALVSAIALLSVVIAATAAHEGRERESLDRTLQAEERAVAVCDAFDAMTSIRPYRTTPMSVENALAELRRSAGTQFDPAVVSVFESVLAEERVSAAT
jgi:spermidine/putrescine-binding protein